MKKTLVALGLVVLVATGAAFPASTLEVQPVAEIVAESDAIVASPDVVLSHAKPVVTTTPAPEPVAVVAEPVVAPVAPVEPTVVYKPVTVAPVAPVAAKPVAVDSYSGNPIVECPAGKVRAEDYTCVAASYWTPAVTPVVAEAVKPAVAEAPKQIPSTPKVTKLYGCLETYPVSSCGTITQITK